VLDRLEAVLEHLDEEEDEDPRRAGVEERPHRHGQVADPPHGKAEKDRKAGNGSEQQDLAFGQSASLTSDCPSGS
jgi:hypothetical protein